MMIYYSPRFERSYKRLDPQIRKASEKSLTVFRLKPLDQRLKTHRLHGKLKGFWSFSVDSRYRILFEFLNADQSEAIFLDIGNHSLYN